jgi:plasmid replication initiation protein
MRTCCLTRNPQLGDPVAGSTSPATTGGAMHRAAVAPDDRLRHETGHEAARLQAMRDQGRDYERLARVRTRLI